MSTTIEGLKPILLLGGYNAAELWPTVNLCLLSWGLLIFAPRWRYTPTLTLISPVIHAVMYTLAIASAIMSASSDDPPVDMMTFEGVVSLFQDPNGVFVGWVHYLVYDVLVGRWMVLDSVERGATSVKFHVLVMVPLLVVALMFAPIGWLLYVAVVRQFFLPTPLGGKPSGLPSASGKGAVEKPKPKLY